MDWPRLIDSKLQRVEIVVCETVTARERHSAGWSKTYLHRPAWYAAANRTTEDLLDWFQLYKRAEVITLNAINITDRGNVHVHEPVYLPSLKRLDLRGPAVTNMFEFASMLSPAPSCALTVLSAIDGMFIPPTDALKCSGLNGTTALDMIVEASIGVRWTTVCESHSRDDRRPAFADGEEISELTGEDEGKASFYVRPGAVSRRQLTVTPQDHDPLLAFAQDSIQRLVIREIGRMHRGVRTWITDAFDFDFLTNLTHVTTVEFEDERVSAMALKSVTSPLLESVAFTCRPDWRGPSGLSSFAENVVSAAKIQRKQLHVTIYGAVRWWDEGAIEDLETSRHIKFKDARETWLGIEAKRQEDPIRRDLQRARRELEEAKARVDELEADAHLNPGLY
ncbi:unnamed protein product [Peniophora sp. CBMAI 1063]|nr:unnamed protein product [Peniophora sp. CBMAI 1063]